MSVLEIVPFALTLMIGFSIIWSTLALGISPMPSSSKARKAVLQLASETGNGSIYDLGSGWGGLLVALARKYPQRKIVGYELSFLPWLVTLILKEILGLKNLEIYRRDFYQADLKEAAVIVCYLFPEGMKKLEDKISSDNIDNKNLEYLISNNFALPSHKPFQTIQLNDFYKSPVYLYKFKD